MTEKAQQGSHPGVSARHGLLAGGNWIIDHVKLIDAWPAQESLVVIEDQGVGNGGGPYNLLKDLARMRCNLPLAGVGLIGQDADGDYIIRDCDEHGIDRAGLQSTRSTPTSYTDVMTVRGTGRRTFFHRYGANARLGSEHFSFANSAARIFYLGYMCLLQRLDAVNAEGQTEAADVFARARATGLVTVADLVSTQGADFVTIVSPSLPHLDYLLLNEYELARLAGCPVAMDDAASLAAAARQVLERGVRQGVVVHRPDFALWVAPGEEALVQPSVQVPQDLIRGSVGAGDAFAAGWIYGLHEGWERQACLELGVCVAAASLRDATSSGAIEPWKDCLALGRRLGFLTLPPA